MYLKRCDKGFVGIILFFNLQVFFMNQEFTNQQYGKNYTDHSHRIGYRTPQSRSTALYAHLFKCLLRSSQGRSISRGSAKDTHHIRKRHTCRITGNNSQQSTQQNYGQRQHIQRHPSFPERTEETGPYLKPQ